MNFKFCKKCVAMTPHNNNQCQFCFKGQSEAINSLYELSQADLVEMTLTTMYVASVTDARLTILMDWLNSYKAIPFVDGMMEEVVTRAKEEAVHKVGDYLREIYQMDDSTLFNESIQIKLKD